MAYTREEYTNLLKEIAMSGGDTPKMLGLLQKLRDDYDEREGMLKRYNETADTTPIEGQVKAAEEIRNESEEDNREDGGERRDPVSREEFERLKADYDNIRRTYINSYFGEGTDVVEQEEHTPEVTDFNDLFK